MKLPGPRALARALACAASGALLFLSCASFDIWPLAWVGMLPLLVVVLDESCEHPFLYGWITGLVANGGGFYWIDNLLRRFGHMPAIASLPIFALLIAYQALAFGLFAWALRRLRDGTRLPPTLLAPLVMVTVELVVPFPFPWYLAITQAWVRPVIQIADLTGPLGVTFLLVLANGALYELWSRQRRQAETPNSDIPKASHFPVRPVAAALSVIALALIYGQIRIRQVEARRAAAPHLKVGVVQANIGITEKWAPGLRERHLQIHQALSADLQRRGAELIVWPESSYPYVFDRRQGQDFADRRRVHQGFDAPILFGAITYGGDDSPYPFNSALLLDSDGQLRGRFDKNFLLVFGEYIPFYEHMPWVREYIPEASNFARGDGVTTFALRPGVTVGPMICYEDIIPSFGRRLAAERPNLLVNITNDAWFGATSEPYEHLALAVYRAVEHRLDLVRAVNTGVSAFVDATGRVVERGPAVDPEETPEVRPQTLLADTAVLSAGGLYRSLGDAFGIANLLAVLGLGAWARRRSGRPIRARPLAVAALILVAALAVGAGAAGLAGAGGAGLALRQLLHLRIEAGQASLAFRAALLILPFGALGSLAAGFAVGRARDLAWPPKLEATVAAALVVLVPPLLVGRIEGDTFLVVASGAGAIALARFGVRLAQRRAPAAATTATPTTTPPTTSSSAKRKRSRR